MTFSYLAGGSTKDDVRLLVGDVDESAMPTLCLQDEDIERILELEGSLFFAAASAADVLSSKFARQAEGSQGPDRIVASGRAAELRMLAARLRTRGAAMAVPSAGGISLGAKRTAECDPDRVAQPFRKGMLDHP